MSETTAQSLSLFILRVFIGWHLLYEGLIKILNPAWTSLGYLKGSKWILSDFFLMITKNATLLAAVDVLNQWGLALIGLGLVLGLFTRVAAISGIILLSFYYLSAPPLVGLEYSMPSEGSYLIINKNLIEIAALFLLTVFSAGNYYGMDLFWAEKQME